MIGLCARAGTRRLALALLAVLATASIAGRSSSATSAPIEVPGEIEASDAVWVGRREVHSKYRASVIEKIVPEGTRVKKGDFLLSVETRLWERDKQDALGVVKRRELELAGTQAQLATAESELEAAREKLPSRLEPHRLAIKRLKGLPDPVALSSVQSELERAQAQLAEAEEQVKAAEAMVEARAESGQALIEARFALDLAAADVALAQARLGKVQQGADAYDLEIAEAELAMAQVDAELEVAELAMTAAACDLKVRQAETRLSRARKDFEFWEAAITNATRYAPADGIVVYEKTYTGGGQVEKIAPGVTVSWGRRICSIISGNAFRFRGRASEAVLGRLRPGQQAQVKLGALPDEVLAGRVTALDVASVEDDLESPPITELERSRPKEFEVLIALEQTPEGLMAGLGGTAVIVPDEAPARRPGQGARTAGADGAEPGSPRSLRFAGYVEPMQKAAVLTNDKDAGTILGLAPQYAWLEEGDVILETTGDTARAYVARAEDAPKLAQAELEQLRLSLAAEERRWQAEVQKAELELKAAELRREQLGAEPGRFAIEAGEAGLRRAELERDRARQLLELARTADLDSLQELRAKELEATLAGLRVQEASTRLAQVKNGAPAQLLQEAEMDIEETRARLSFARAMADEMAPVRDAELAVARAAVLGAEEELQYYHHCLEQRIVRAPVAGNIIYNTRPHFLRARVGLGDDLPAASQGIGYVADLSKLKFIAIVEEPYVGQIRAGARARIELLAFPGRSFSGEVLSIVPVVMDREEVLVPESDVPRLSGVRATRVDILFELPPGEDLRVLPGMTGTVFLLPSGQRRW
ncbi:MAG: hypothetical protein KAX44_07740 [Candidatus Brocadiae bacterium]|nr:hypothetical protein [Candidatus Brocadiia bacterium]